MSHTLFLACIHSAGCGEESVVLSPGCSHPLSILADCMIQQLAVIWLYYYLSQPPSPLPLPLHTDTLTVSLVQLESCDQHAASYLNVFPSFLCTEDSLPRSWWPPCFSLGWISWGSNSGCWWPGMFFKSRCCLRYQAARCYACSLATSFFSHLMTDFPQIGNRQLIVLHFIYLSPYFYVTVHR